MKLSYLLVTLLSAWLSGLTCTAAQPDTLAIHFATQPEAQHLLTADDEFTAGLNQFDYDLRLSKPHSTADEWRQLARHETRSWAPGEKQRIIKAFRTLRQNVQQMQLQLPYPEEVVLVKTTMREELRAGGYTRKNWIALGALELIYANDDQLATLLAHELFHVLSRHSASFKQAVYATIGFRLLDHEIVFPADVMQKRISNPDIAHRNSYTELILEGKKTRCAEMIYTDRPYTSGSILDYLHVGFIPLNARFEPVVVGGKTVIYPLDQVAEQFKAQVGTNTNYNIDPEEISADHFSFLLTKKEGLPNPEIIDAIRTALQTPRR